NPSAAHQSRNLTVCQNLYCLAAEDYSGHAFTTMRGHENKVATVLLCSGNNRFIGVVVYHVYALIRDVGGLGSVFRYTEVVFGSGITIFLVLLRRVGDHHWV